MSDDDNYFHTSGPATMVPTVDSMLGASAAHHESVCVLAAGQRFTGKMCFSGRTRIDGTFSGQLFGDGTLYLGSTAKVQGTIEVRTLIVAGGEIQAEVQALDYVELRQGTKMQGTVSTPLFLQQSGSSYSGTWICTKQIPR